jgi:hypothetical protein
MPNMQSISRSAYSDAFSYSDPKATGNLLKARMAAAREVNERLAQYFSERAEVSVVSIFLKFMQLLILCYICRPKMPTQRQSNEL